MLRSQVFDGAELSSIGDATESNPPSFMDRKENGMEDEREGSSEGSGGSARKKRRSLPDSADMDGEMLASGEDRILVKGLVKGQQSPNFGSENT